MIIFALIPNRILYPKKYETSVRLVLSLGNYNVLTSYARALAPSS